MGPLERKGSIVDKNAEELDIIFGDAPGYRFRVIDSPDVVKMFWTFIEDTETPANAGEISDNYRRWAERLFLDMLYGPDEELYPCSELYHICWSAAALLKSVPEDRDYWLTEGIEKALNYMSGRMVSVRFVVRIILRNMWNMSDYKKEGFRFDNENGNLTPDVAEMKYYYVTLAFIVACVACYIQLVVSGTAKSGTFSPLKVM